MFDDQAQHIAYIIDTVKKRGEQVVEPTAEAEDAWVQQISRWPGSARRRSSRRARRATTTTKARAPAANMQNSPYAPGINAFNALLKEWRDADTLDGMTID